jgi:hypothetical protein
MAINEYQRLPVQYVLLSPMRIGHRKIGNLQTTRLYVPGITLWASAVNRLVRRFPGIAPDAANPYAFWGGLLRDCCRFSSLFLLDTGGGSNNRLLPGDAGCRQNIERLFIGSSVHTAIEHDNAVVEEGMLHELEWIQPTRPGGHKALSLSGWVDMAPAKYSDDVSISKNENGSMVFKVKEAVVDVKEILAEATVGADLNIGCGRLGNAKWGETERVARIEERCESSPVPGQLLAGDGVYASGRLESIVGRATLPIEEPTPANFEARLGSYFYQYLAYAPGATSAGKLVMNWFGRFQHVVE